MDQRKKNNGCLCLDGDIVYTPKYESVGGYMCVQHGVAGCAGLQSTFLIRVIDEK